MVDKRMPAPSQPASPLPIAWAQSSLVKVAEACPAQLKDPGQLDFQFGWLKECQTRWPNLAAIPLFEPARGLRELPPTYRLNWLLGRYFLSQFLADAPGDLETVSASVSHSAGEVMVARAEKAALWDGRPIAGVGIDLERVARSVSNRAASRIISSGGPGAAALSTLELWCVKEACFKAWGGNRGRVLSEIQVMAWGDSHGNATAGQGTAFVVGLIPDSVWIRAWAVSLGS